MTTTEAIADGQQFELQNQGETRSRRIIGESLFDDVQLNGLNSRSDPKPSDWDDYQGPERSPPEEEEYPPITLGEIDAVGISRGWSPIDYSRLPKKR